jgi:hypothetical protein
MRNVTMIRKDSELISIPVEKAIYCENCETVSTSASKRCGLCGSEQIVDWLPCSPSRGTQDRRQPYRWQHNAGRDETTNSSPLQKLGFIGTNGR